MIGHHAPGAVLATNRAPDPVAPDEDVSAVLSEAKQARKTAEQSAQRAETQVQAAVGVLRRIAEALERNPTTWDDLLGADRRER